MEKGLLERVITGRGIYRELLEREFNIQLFEELLERGFLEKRGI